MSDKIKPKEIIYGFNDWIKKNMFTVIGIFIIISFVLYDMATVQKDKQDIVNKCNEYWFNQVQRVCPVLSTQKEAAFDFNVSLSKNIDVGGLNDKVE